MSEKLTIFLNKYLNLNIYVKILLTLVVSIIVHISFKSMLLFGFYNYLKTYQLHFYNIKDFDISILYMSFYFHLILNFLIICTIMYSLYRASSVHFSKIKKSSDNEKNISKFIQVLQESSDIIIFAFFAFLIGFFLILSNFNLVFLHYVSIFILPIVFSIFLGKVIPNLNKIIFILILPCSLLLGSLNAINSISIENKLKQLGIGGEIPITIYTPQKIENVYLLLLTENYIYYINSRDYDNANITVIKRDKVEKIESKLNKNLFRFNGVNSTMSL